MGWYWKIWYGYRDWQCRRFGHLPYEEHFGGDPHIACKRGCGPLDYPDKIQRFDGPTVFVVLLIAVVLLYVSVQLIRSPFFLR